MVAVVSGWGKLKFLMWPEKYEVILSYYKTWSYCKHVNDHRYTVNTGEKKLEEKWKSGSEELLEAKISIFQINLNCKTIGDLPSYMRKLSFF